jgi:hypothetical protein
MHWCFLMEGSSWESESMQSMGLIINYSSK